MIIYCPHCQQKFNSPPEMAGQTIKCSTCNGLFKVPIPEAIIPEAIIPEAIIPEAIIPEATIPGIKSSANNIGNKFKVITPKMAKIGCWIIVIYIFLSFFRDEKDTSVFKDITTILFCLSLLSVFLLKPDLIKCTCGYYGIPKTVGRFRYKRIIIILILFLGYSLAGYLHNIGHPPWDGFWGSPKTGSESVYAWSVIVFRCTPLLGLIFYFFIPLKMKCCKCGTQTKDDFS